MLACAKRLDITPDGPVWMDGMIRAHPSTGIRDQIYAKSLALANSKTPADCFVLVSVDVCILCKEDAWDIRKTAADATGIHVGNIILAATHTHSGPALSGVLGNKADEYLKALKPRISDLIVQTVAGLKPAVAGWAAAKEKTISHYRRLMADDGHVVMNWEPYDPAHIIGPLGQMDPEVLILRVTTADAAAPIALLFNHPCHPNVLSGDNYLISGDYPGLTEKMLQEKFGGVALFMNGAQGSVDIDGLKDRDEVGLQRVAGALADAIRPAAEKISPADQPIVGANHTFKIPARKITDEEIEWADNVLKQAGDTIAVMPDGVGDDYKAQLYKKLRKIQDQDVAVEQTCVAVGDVAMLSFPGELFTEIGMHIKEKSPFRHTAIIGLANGYVGYVPTAKAIMEGGYEPDTRNLDAAAEDLIVTHSLKLLNQTWQMTQKKK
jgi:neutral ceramidase